MVTQNTTTAAGAAPTGARIRLNTPQANQQVVIDNIAGATLEMGFPSEAAQLEQSGQDLVFLFENGGRIVLSNFFGLFESNQLPAFNLEDGQSLPGDAFLAALREDLLPAAGPGAGAAAGSGGVGDYADDAGDLIGGVDRLDPLGTTGIGTAALQGIEDEGPLDLATGSLLITINTNISTTIEQNGEYPEHPDAVPPGAYAGVFEDWAPNQHLGSPLTFEAVLGFIFTPTDNEVLDSITITGPIAGTLLVGGVPVAADGAGNFVISAADIDDVTLLPLADSGTDIPLSGFASITDPDSGLSGTVPFAFTAVVDAVADQPTGVHETVSYGPFYCDHGNGDYGNGDGEVVTARVMDSEGDERSFWHHNPHDAPNGPWWKNTAADPTETEDGDHTQSAVKITLSATFGDYQDGSESHFLLIEAKDGWTYDTVNIGGVELDLSEFLTLGADIPASATQGLGVIDPAGYYYVIPVGDESIVATSQSVDGQGQTHELATKAVTLTLYAPDEDYVPGGNGGYEGNGEYEGPVIATLDQGYNGDGEHCGRGNDYKETFVTGALAVDSDADGSLVAVNDNSLVFGSTDVWVAAAEGHIYVTGQQIGYEDPQAFAHDPPTWYDPFSTKDIDLDFHFSGADDEHLDYLRIAVDVNTPAKVLIFGSEATFVPDGEGGGYYIVPAYLKDHVTLMPAKDSDVDVKLTVTAVFHDPDSGDVGTDTTQHTVFIDAVADKPIAHDADVDYTPGPTAADPGGAMTVILNASFGDYQDGSERQYVGIEVKHGWNYPGSEGTKWVEGRLYAIYDVTDEVDAGSGSVSLSITLGVPNTDDRYYTEFKTIAVAKETSFSGVEWNYGNNEAYDIDSVRVLVDGADGCLQVSGGGFEDWKPYANVGNETIIKTQLGIDFNNADNENLTGAEIKFAGRAFTLVVGEDPSDPGYREIVLDSWGESASVSVAEMGHLYVKTTLNSDRDIPVEVKVTFIDPDSGDAGSTTDTHTLTIDAVADKPVITVDVNDGGDGGSAFQTGETGTVHVTASFADTDGSEDHWVELKIPSGFSVNLAEIAASGGTWNGTTRTVKWDIDSNGSLDKTIHVTQNGAGDGAHDFVAKAVAKEGAWEGLGNFNNQAESTATDAAVVNSGRCIQWAITDAADVRNIVPEGNLGENGPPLAFTVGYSGYALEPGETVSIQLTGPAADSTAGLADFTNAADDFAAALQAAVGAVSGISYDAATNTLTFNYGAPTSLTFFAKVFGDTVIESNEDLVITIQNPKFNGFVGGTVADPSEDGTIIDDDKPIIVPPTGGDELSLSLQDVDAAGAAEDHNDGDLDFTAGSLPLEFAFDISAGHEPVVSGIDPSTPITWSIDPGTHNLVGSIGGQPAIILTLDPEAGPYTVGQSVQVNVEATLINPLLHDDGATDIVVTNVHVTGTDTASNTVHGTVSVSVDDANPMAAPEVNDYSGGITTNLVIVLDSSGSMGPNVNEGGGDPDGPGGFDTKYALAVAAIQTLLDAYKDLGAVNVQIVDFDGDAVASGWFTGGNSTTSAITWINNNTEAGGGTNYDDAIAATRAALEDGLPPADRSVVYFLSDGNPNSGDELSSGDATAWDNFLATTPIETVYAYGMGEAVSQTQLERVAWDSDGTPEANPVEVITNLSQLEALLLSTVPVTGNLLANDNGGADGGLKLDSVTVDGYAYDLGDTDANHKIAIDLGDNKGFLTIDFDDGSYVFTPGSNPVGQEIVNYDVRDADGTLAHTTLTLNLRAAELDAHDNYATAQPGSTTTTTDTFSSSANDWSTDDDYYGDVSRVNTAGDRELMLELEWGAGASVTSSKTFSVAAGDTLSFDWRAEPFRQGSSSLNPHDDDKFLVVISGPDGTVTLNPFTSPTSGAGGSGLFTHTFGATGNYTVTLKVLDGTSNNNPGYMRVFVDDVVFTHALAGAALLGNVVTDHTGTDLVDQIGGQTAFVTEVNGVAIANDGLYHDVVGDYGTLRINAFGQYEYHANGNAAAGNDDAFVYKLASSTDSDYATLNVHIGDTANHLQASAENWTGGSGNDFHLGGTGGDTLNGGNGNDVIFGNYGDDTIHGNAGHDILHGNAGNDTLYGDAGNDTLIGGQGSDILNGGTDADTFVWNAEDFTTSAVDRVTDFNMGEGDVLRFSDVLIGNNPDVVAGGALAGTDANDAVVTLHNGAQTQYVVIQDALNTNTLDQIEQHILTNKIITENS